jgi:hypothetical protein
MSGSLSHPPSMIIAKLIEDLGKGTNPSASSVWPIYVDFSPDSPDQLIVVFTSPGSLKGKDHVVSEETEHFGFQLSVRSSSFSPGESKARAIAIEFDEEVQNKAVSLGGSNYIISSIKRKSSVLNPTRNIEGSRRNLFTFHATTSIREV